jgi:hypothetical protein
MIKQGSYSTAVLRQEMLENVLASHVPLPKAQHAVDEILEDVLNGVDVVLSDVGHLTHLEGDQIAVLPVESALNTFVAGSVSASSSGLTDNNPGETEFVPTLGAEVEIRELVEIGYSRAGAEKILEDARAMPAYVTRFD